MDELDLAYAAGFLDGEGCFYVDPVTHKASISVSNTYLPTILWLGELFGFGTITHTKGKKSNHRPVHTWRVADAQAKFVAGAIGVHLKEKKEQALALLAVQQTKSRGGPNTVTADTKDLRTWLALRMKELKHVSW